MSQNRSHAVMAQRVEAHDSLDDFPTPPWGTRALIERVIRRELAQKPETMTVWEPCCNRGYMAYPLAEAFGDVIATDVHAYGDVMPDSVLWGLRGCHDFLQPYLPEGIAPPDWIIANPPFRLGAQFVTRAMEVAERGVAMLVRTAFLESDTRFQDIYSRRPPTYIAQFVERLPMVKGRVDRKASTATAYAWLVWQRGPAGWLSIPGESRFLWIPPCRAQLERDDDYPEAA